MSLKITTLLPRIREILTSSNLDEITCKIVREHLEKEFGKEVQAKNLKQQINNAIVDMIQSDSSSSSSSEAEEEKEEEEKSKKNNPFNRLMLLSPELSALLNVSSCSRPNVVKKMWDYIRTQELQDPNDKRTILLNKELKRVFGCSKFTMFQMNKYISVHLCKDAEELEQKGGWDNFDRKNVKIEESTEPKVKKEKKRKRSSESTTNNSGLNAPLKLSKELSKFIGKQTESRPQVVKCLWNYIKEHELQNPENKREILCDDTLQSIFQQETVTMFSMNQFLKPHFLGKPDEDK